MARKRAADLTAATSRALAELSGNPGATLDELDSKTAAPAERRTSPAVTFICRHGTQAGRGRKLTLTRANADHLVWDDDEIRALGDDSDPLRRERWTEVERGRHWEIRCPTCARVHRVAEPTALAAAWEALRQLSPELPRYLDLADTHLVRRVTVSIDVRDR